MELRIHLGAGKRHVSARLGRQAVDANLSMVDRRGKSSVLDSDSHAVARRVVGMFAASQRIAANRRRPNSNRKEA
jgi:hypothetical protein